MNKIGSFLCLVIIVAIVFTGACTAPRQNNTTQQINNNTVLQKDGYQYLDHDQLTSDQTTNAIHIALDNPEVKTYLIGQVPNITYVGTLSGQSGGPGYSNVSWLPVQVTIEYPNYIGKNRVIVIINLNTSTVMDVEWYSYRGGLPMFANATIPPGSSWYHGINMVGTSLVLSIEGYTPSDADIYPIIVDEENLNNWKNGSQYYAAELMSRDTNNVTTINGTEAIAEKPLKNLSITSQPPADETEYMNFWKNHTYYLILNNNDKYRDVILSFAS